MSPNRIIPVAETTLPNGLVVPAFQVAAYLASKGEDGKPMSVAENAPWVEIDYSDARKACESAGFRLITETQALAIAWQISQQDANWSSGKVGEGSLYQGLHLDTVDEAQNATFESDDPAERRWHVLANGERIYDAAGNAFTWVYDDVQGDDEGLISKAFAKDSPSIATAPYPSMERGMGWRPRVGANWSGRALIRGGFWYSDALAGVFCLLSDWPVSAVDYVGFRCTNPGL